VKKHTERQWSTQVTVHSVSDTNRRNLVIYAVSKLLEHLRQIFVHITQCRTKNKPT